MRSKSVYFIIAGILLVITGVLIEFGGFGDPTNDALFNDYIANKFSEKYFEVSASKDDEHYKTADLKISFDIRNEKGNLYISSKWIKHYTNNTIEIATRDEVAEYKTFGEESAPDLFKVIGIGGTPDQPKILFVVPTSKIRSQTVKISQIDKFKKADLSENFYYDLEDKILQ